jgi:hypothetical protein
MRKLTLFLCILLSVFLMSSVSHAGLVWDVASDWSDSTNPNGPWIYRVNNTIASSYTRNGDSFSYPPGPPKIWSLPEYAPNGSTWIGWSRSNTSEPSSLNLPVGTIYGHTLGSSSGYIEIQWKSPITGTISITGSTWLLRNSWNENPIYNRSVNWSLTAGSTTLSGLLYADQNSPYMSDSLSNVLNVTSGDIISFKAISTGEGDYLGLNLTISAVPIPAAVWLLGSGLIGLIGVRRFKK